MRDRVRAGRTADRPASAPDAAPRANPGGLAGLRAGQIDVSPPGERVEGPPVQRRGGPASSAGVAIPSAGGRPLPESTRTRMESALGADFGAVRTFTGSHVPALGAEAFTRGEQVHFAPGRMNDRNLGHELAHVVQQRQGRVKPTGSVRGVPLNDDPALEREADRMSERAGR